MSLGKFTNTLIALSVFILVVLIAWFAISHNNAGTQINTNQTAVIKEMRNLQRLETASFTIEKVIDGGTTGNNVFTQFLFGDKILLIAHGQVIAGFDLSQISENDIKVDGKNLTITLPQPQILTTTLDNTQTRVYDRQKGLLAPEDKDLESKAREAAEKSIQEAACKGGILQQAADNARKQLTALFSSLGFSSVTIEIPNGSC
ncbi:MAG TPA: DUF4230 domain-containing protein [Candidatus Saccharimonadales bacterium]|nr:DUF4230 domain-containing protein [Candidatus Saccharimonadales bacterium]HSW97126.1 DUF4230 domain-containing protein [Candidatus Saccharimonadales bacterium]